MSRELAILFIGFCVGIAAAIALIVMLTSICVANRPSKMGDDIRLGDPLSAEKLLRHGYRGFVAICNIEQGQTRLALRDFGGFYDDAGVFRHDSSFDWKGYGKRWVAYTLTDFDRFETEEEKA